MRDWFAQAMFIAAGWLAVMRVRPRAIERLTAVSTAKIYRLKDRRPPPRL